MDSLITAAARALATGDILGALKRVGVRDDPPALALRGIAMAQLGDFERAKVLLRRAALEAHGDRINAAHARILEVRRLLLIGHLDEAEQALVGFEPAPLPPALSAALNPLEA